MEKTASAPVSTAWRRKESDRENKIERRTYTSWVVPNGQPGNYDSSRIAQNEENAHISCNLISIGAVNNEKGKSALFSPNLSSQSISIALSLPLHDEATGIAGWQRGRGERAERVYFCTILGERKCTAHRDAK